MYRVINAGGWTIYETADLAAAIEWAAKHREGLTASDRFYAAGIVDENGRAVKGGTDDDNGRT